jgi:hypothetical protein
MADQEIAGWWPNMRLPSAVAIDAEYTITSRAAAGRSGQINHRIEFARRSRAPDRPLAARGSKHVRNIR